MSHWSEWGVSMGVSAGVVVGTLGGSAVKSFAWKAGEMVLPCFINFQTITFVSATLFGPGDRPVGWGSSTRRGGGRRARALPRKFVFFSRVSKEGSWDVLGIFAETSRNCGGVQKVCAKRVCDNWSAPNLPLACREMDHPGRDQRGSHSREVKLLRNCSLGLHSTVGPSLGFSL